MANRRVVITGLGTVNPLAWDVETFWNRLLAGENAAVPITRFPCESYTSRIGGQISDDWPGIPEKYVDKRERKRFDHFAAYAVAAAIEAVENSGIDFDKCNRDRCGVVIGSGIGGLLELEQQHERLLGNGGRVSPFTVPKLMVNAAAGNVGILWNLRGPNTAVATACASAGNAIGDAFRLIQRGFTDVMLTGGAEAALTKLGLSSFCALKALTTRNDDPKHASRPFDKNRDGFLLSEGAGVIVLEDLDHAKARGANIMGEVIGYGMTCDASHITAPDPEGRGAAEAMRQALKDASLAPEDVDYINAHGTSTQLNDAAETKAIKAVFGQHCYDGMLISSTKSAVGHLLGASGGVEIIAVVKTLLNKVIPATQNLEEPDEGCDLDYCALKNREKDVKIAISNSFGFGGHNVVLAVRKYTGD